MKRIKLITILFLLFFIILITTGADCGLRSFWGGTQPVELGINNVGTIINKVIDWLLGIVATVAVVFIMIGGVQYIMAIGNPEAAQKAKTTLTYAFAGLILVLAAYAIVKFIASWLLKTSVF